MTVKIPIIPEGYYVRTYQLVTLSFIVSMHRSMGFVAKYLGDEIVLEGDPQDVASSVAEALEASLDIIKDRLNHGITSPRMHNNDISVLTKKLMSAVDVKIPEKLDYCSVFEVLINWAINAVRSSPQKYLSELSIMHYDKEGNILLGSPPHYGPLQPFKLEKYETGKDFLDFTVKGDIKHSHIWTALLSAGWLITYMGNFGTLLFSMPTDDTMHLILASREAEEFLLESIGTPKLTNAYKWEGYFSTPSRIKRNPVPGEAYQLILAAELPQVTQTLPPIRLMRVNYDLRRFTILSDGTINVAPLTEFIRRLKSRYPDALGYVREVADCLIQAYSFRLGGYCRDRYGEHSTLSLMVHALYAGGQGAMEAEKVIYTLARLSPAGTETPPPFRRSKILEGIYDALPRKAIRGI
jgi:hypothetical protein